MTTRLPPYTPPQRIDRGATPTFTGINLSGLAAAGLLAAGVGGALAAATSGNVISTLGYTPANVSALGPLATAAYTASDKQMLFADGSGVSGTDVFNFRTSNNSFLLGNNGPFNLADTNYFFGINSLYTGSPLSGWQHNFRSNLTVSYNADTTDLHISVTGNAIIGATNTGNMTVSDYPAIAGVEGVVTSTAGSSGTIRRVAAIAAVVVANINGARFDEGIGVWIDPANTGTNFYASIKATGLDHGTNNTGVFLGIDQGSYPAVGNWGIYDLTGYASYLQGGLSLGAASDPGAGNLAMAGAVTAGAWHASRIGLAYGGTNADLSATGGAHQVVMQTTAGGALSVAQLAATDLTGLGYFATGTDATNLTGTVSVNRFNSGTGASTSTFLRGDGTWTPPTAPNGAALTKTDDTNVTLTLGGTPATALLQATSLTLGWTGQLALSRGGTGANLSATGGTSQFLKQATVGGAITVAQPAQADIAGLTTADSPTFKGATLAAGSIATSAPGLTVTQTWTGGSGVTYTGALLNITDTSSAAASLLMDLQVGGASKFKVDKAGSLTMAGNLTISGTNLINASTTGLFLNGASGITVYIGAGQATSITSTLFNLINTTAQFGINNDTFLSRPAAATWQHGAADVATGAIAQTLQVQSNTGAQNGPNFTIKGSNSGAGNVGGSVVIQTATGGVYGNALTLAADKSATFGGVVNAASIIAAKLYPAADSATAIQITKADASTVVGAWDTTNGYLNIGGAAAGTSRLNIYTNASPSILTGVGDGVKAAVNIFTFFAGAGGSNIQMYHGRGTFASPSASIAGDVVSTFFFNGYDTSAATRAVANFSATIDTVTGSNDMSGYLTWGTRNDGAGASILEGMRLTKTRGLNVGTYVADPGAANLNLQAGVLKISGTQVVGARDTGWTPQTASPSKGDLGASPTVGAIASWASAVQAALTTHGLLGA